MLLFGTMVGISLNKVMPPFLILVALTLVLILNTIKTLSKARSLQVKENMDRVPIKVGLSNAASAAGKVEMGELSYGRQIDEDGVSTGNPSEAVTPHNGRLSMNSSNCNPDREDSPKQNYKYG